MTAALIIVDTETTGLDPKKHVLVEVAGVLFDLEEGTIIAACSDLISAPSNPARHINRIPETVLLQKWALHPRDAEDQLMGLHATAEQACDEVYVLAHNAAFDRQWLPTLASEADWLCSHDDAVWLRCPLGASTLINLALAHDVGVTRAHRALDDCLTLAAILSRAHELEGGLNDWLARALEPKVEVIARVSFHARQLAKDAGFKWDADRKLWVRIVPASTTEAWYNALPFDVLLPEGTLVPGQA